MLYIVIKQKSYAAVFKRYMQFESNSFGLCEFASLPTHLLAIAKQKSQFKVKEIFFRLDCFYAVLTSFYLATIDELF